MQQPQSVAAGGNRYTYRVRTIEQLVRFLSVVNARDLVDAAVGAVPDVCPHPTSPGLGSRTAGPSTHHSLRRDGSLVGGRCIPSPEGDYQKGYQWKGRQGKLNNRAAPPQPATSQSPRGGCESPAGPGPSPAWRGPPAGPALPGPRRSPSRPPRRAALPPLRGLASLRGGGDKHSSSEGAGTATPLSGRRPPAVAATAAPPDPARPGQPGPGSRSPSAFAPENA